MDLADETAHRALAYVAAAQRQGHVMTVDELEAYMAGPGRRPGTPGQAGTPSRTIRTTNVDRAVGQLARQATEPLFKSLVAQVLAVRATYIEGTPGTPDKPPETTTEWLTRLRWLRRDAGCVRTTPLGEAILRHLEQASVEEEVPVSVVLDQGDELAQARVMGQMADLGSCAVVDRFFSIESLLPIVYSTQVETVLTGTSDQRKLTELEVALNGLRIERPFEVRKSDVFHDRFVIPRTGPVWLLGTSFTGLGRRLSMLVELRDETVSTAIRREFHEAWEAAESVGQRQFDAEAEPPSSQMENGDGSNSGDETDYAEG